MLCQAAHGGDRLDCVGMVERLTRNSRILLKFASVNMKRGTNIMCAVSGMQAMRQALIPKRTLSLKVFAGTTVEMPR